MAKAPFKVGDIVHYRNRPHYMGVVSAMPKIWRSYESKVTVTWGDAARYPSCPPVERLEPCQLVNVDLLISQHEKRLGKLYPTRAKVLDLRERILHDAKSDTPAPAGELATTEAVTKSRRPFIRVFD